MSHVDRRHSQTQDRYAADDLETMQEATRYTAHVFNLFRPHIGARVLEVGCGIATMSRLLAEISEEVVAIEPNENCAVLARQAMRDSRTSACGTSFSRTLTPKSSRAIASTPSSV